MSRARALLCGFIYLSANAAAAQSDSLLGITLTPSKEGTTLGVPMQIIVLLTALTVLPAAMVSVTPFLRITVVMHFLRQAMGTQTTPSNQVLLGIALFLTLLIMHPVATEIYEQGWAPMEQGEITLQEAMERSGKPLKDFLRNYVREKDVQLLLEISKTPAPATPEELELKILVPAYVLSELKTGFQIGAVQLPPVMLSSPFQVLLFVLVDGWNLVVGSLMKSFY